MVRRMLAALLNRPAVHGDCWICVRGAKGQPCAPHAAQITTAYAAQAQPYNAAQGR